MSNPAYVGRARFAKGKAHECSIAVPAILDTPEQRAWWDAAQVTRAKNKAEWAGRPSPNYLFQHFIFCACGKRMTGRGSGRNRRVYVPHPDCTCSAHEVRCEKVDTNVYSDIIRCLSDVETSRGLLRGYHEHQKAAQPVGPSRAERRKLQRDRIAARRVLGDGDLISIWDENKKRLLAIDAEIATLERQEAQAAKVFQMPSEPTIQSFARDIAELGRAQDYDTRRGLVERVVTRLIWEGRGNYIIEGRIMLAQKPMKSGSQNWDHGSGADAQRQGRKR